MVMFLQVYIILFYLKKENASETLFSIFYLIGWNLLRITNLMALTFKSLKIIIKVWDPPKLVIFNKFQSITKRVARIPQ